VRAVCAVLCARQATACLCDPTLSPTAPFQPTATYTGHHYGRIVSGKPPFEELALLLVDSGEPEALQAFLQTKLQVRACAAC
jgi:hypothetical protein